MPVIILKPKIPQTNKQTKQAEKKVVLKVKANASQVKPLKKEF